jgi:hypothetical protein
MLLFSIMEPFVIFLNVVASVMCTLIIFAAISLYLTNTEEVWAACGRDMWNMAVASTALRFPMLFVWLCAVIPVFQVRDNKELGVTSSKAMFIGILVAVLIIAVTVFATEVYYSADTLAKPDCVQALKNATGAGDPLITTSTLIFGAFDALLVILILIELSCTPCIFDYAALPPEPEEQEGETGRHLTRSCPRRLLDVEIERNKHDSTTFC